MSQNIPWIRRLGWTLILTLVDVVFVVFASAGQVSSTPSPVASGPGLGFVSIASILTTNPNNDDSPGTQADNNTVFPLTRLDSTGYIDIAFTVIPTAGVTEYQFSVSVDNNTGSNWNAYNMLLGFGTGAGFTQAGGIGDMLDFDTGPPGGNTTPPTSTALPIVTRPNEDSLVFSGGTQGSSAQLYQFRIDVPDLLSRNGTFTLRQQPLAVPSDYNNNGKVDAADYVVWRKGLGTTYTQSDYDVWRAHFGQLAGSGVGNIANAAVPEPATSLQIIVVTAVISTRRRRAA